VGHFEIVVDNTVSADLESCGYAVGAAILPAACVNAPHQRHRIFFVGDAQRTRLEGLTRYVDGQARRAQTPGPIAKAGTACGMADPAGTRLHDGEGTAPEKRLTQPGIHGELAQGLVRCPLSDLQHAPRLGDGFWRDADWLLCRGGEWRPVEPFSQPLVDGAAARVGRLRAYGNAIVPQVAAQFILAFLNLLGNS